MTIRQFGSSRVFGRSAAAIVAMAGLGAGLVQASPLTNPEPEPIAQNAASDFERIQSLLDRGRIIEAQHHLGEYIDREDLSAEELEEFDRLLGVLDRRVRSADPIELSIQKAEMALSQGDIALMKRHLEPVMREGAATRNQRELAQDLAQQGETVTQSVESLASDFTAQAHRDFVEGRFGRAKSTLAVLTRAGVELTADADAIRGQIFQLELERGRPFETAEAAGLFEPGVLTRLADSDMGETRSTLLSIFAEADFANEQPGVIRRDDDDQPEDDAPADDEDVPSLDAPIDLDDAGQPEQEPPAAQPLPDDIIQGALAADAQAKYLEANRAYAQSQFVTAARLYDELLANSRQFFTAEQIQQMERNRADARVSINQPGREGDFIDITIDERQAAAQALRREFDNYMAQSEQRLRSGDIAGARERVSSARLTLSGGRQYLPESEYEQKQDRIAEQQARIVDAEREQLRREAELREQQIIAAADRDRVEQQQQRQAKINEQLDRVRTLMTEQKYEEAYQVVEQTLFLDPNNYAALLMKDIIYDIIISRDYNRIRDRRNKAYAQLVVDNYEASVPIPDIITYPDDWPRISLSRGEPVSASETPENRRVLASLETQRIPVNFDNSLADVVNFLESVTEENFDVDWASLELISIDEQTPVTLNLNNVPVTTVLDRIVDKISDPLSPAGWAVRDGIVQIASDEALRRNTALVIYDIRDLLIEVPDYEDAPQIDLQNVLQSNQGGGGGQSPFDGDQNDDNEERDRQEQIDQITDIIRSNVDSLNWVANGGDTGSIQELNGSLIIRNTPKNHREITGLLSMIRSQRAMQINVETRFLLVNQDFFEEIGFDLDVYFGNNNDMVQFARATDPTVRAGDFFEFNPNNTAPDSGVGLQRSVTGSGFDTAGNQGATTQGAIPPDGLSPVGVAQNSLGLTESLGANAGDFASSILSSAPALGVAGQFLDDIQVDFLVKATQADQRSVQLTAPRLTFTNGQIANIIVATQQAFVSQLTPVVATSAVGFTPTISVVSEGVTMEVEGTVSSDRRYVTMNLQTGVSRINGFAEQAVTAVAGGQLVSSEDVQSFIQLPTTTVTRIQTTVTVPDQGTLLMGGQRLVTEFEVETGVPVVSKIPILNRFFTNRIESKEEQTLLVLVKPTILIQSEQEDKNFPGLNDTLMNSLGG